MTAPTAAQMAQLIADAQVIWGTLGFDNDGLDDFAAPLRGLAVAYQAERTRAEGLEGVVDAYATAARVIALHLREFCDESLTCDQMIAEAARQEAKALATRDAQLAVVTTALGDVREALWVHGGVWPTLTIARCIEAIDAALAQPVTGTDAGRPDPSTCAHDVSCATCGTRWPPRGMSAAAPAPPEPPPLPPPSDDLLAAAAAAYAAYMIHTDQAAAAIRAAGAAEQAGVDVTAEESASEARERAEADLRLAYLANLSGEDWR